MDLLKKCPPKTLGTRVSCETGTGLGGHLEECACIGLYICT